MLVRSESIDGVWIEVHTDPHGPRPFWVKVAGDALFQRRRMRLRKFSNSSAAWKAGLQDAATRRRRSKAS